MVMGFTFIILHLIFNISIGWSEAKWSGNNYNKLKNKVQM